jgi:hypothetical protein
MNSTDLVFKPFSTLYGGQMLDVHLNSVTPDGNRGSLSFLPFERPSQALLLQNAQDRTTICPWENALQFLGNPNRAMVLMLNPVADYRLTVLRGNNGLIDERSRAFVQGTLSFCPPLDGSGIHPKALSQFANAHSLFMQPFDFLTLFQGQSRLGMEFHGFPSFTKHNNVC